MSLATIAPIRPSGPCPTCGHEPRRVVRTGPLVIDLDARTVAVDGAEVYLTPTEWHVLAYLAERIGRVCSAAEIVDEVWGPEWFTVDRLVHVNVSRLRRKLAGSGTWIETRPGLGYVLLETGWCPAPPPPMRVPTGYRPLAPGQWARHFDRCRCCDSKERDHRAHGCCVRCYRHTRRCAP